MDKIIVKDFLIEKLNILKKTNLSSTFRKYEYMNGSTHIEGMKMFHLEQFSEIRTALEKDEIMNDEKKLLYDFLFGYLAKVKSFEFGKNEFDELHEELETYEKTGMYVFRKVMLLVGCRVDEGDSITFNGFNLSHTREYMDFFSWYYSEIKRMDDLELGLEAHISPFNHRNMILEFKQSTRNPNEITENRGDIEKIAKSIRLNYGILSEFTVSPLYTFSYLYKNSQIVRYDYFPELKTVKVVNGIKINNISEIKDIYFLLKSITKFNPDSLAIQRLMSAGTKAKNEDKLIDLMISIESLFPAIQSELVYRVSLCVASLIDGGTEVFHHMKKIYGIRSKIVHGEIVDREKLKESLKLLDTYLKIILYKYIEEDIDPKKIDNIILEKLLSKK